MKRKNIKGKVKFINSFEKRRLEKNSNLDFNLNDFSLPKNFIAWNYVISRNSSYMSILRSDPDDYPNWLNVDEYQIVWHKAI